MPERPRALYWLPALLWIGIIAVESTQGFSSAHTDSWLRPLFSRLLPDLSQPSWELLHKGLRKLGHWTGYFILATTLHWGFRHGDRHTWRWLRALAALGLVLLVASLDELHQAFLPSRTGSPWDVLLDLFGGCCAITLARLRSHWTRPKREGGPERPGLSYPD
nr:VanZ family protein [uncultured Holophaga sp.]